MTWHASALPAAWPVAPPVDALAGPEFLFTLSTGAYSLSDGEVFGMPLGALGIETALDLDGLDTSDFWLRSGPVLAYHKHDLVIGRTIRIHRDHEGLHATMRFTQTPLAADVRRNLEQQGAWAASIGVRYHPFDVTIDAAARRIMVRKATLIEWSLARHGADAGARYEGVVVLHVIPDSEGRHTHESAGRTARPL